MTVRVTQITRMANGGKYQAVESPPLSLWAFYSNLQLDLPPMVEGQTYVPTTNAVVETPVPSVNGQLIIIAATTYAGLSQDDSDWAAFAHSSNFGSGTQDLMTYKTWAELLQGSYRPVWVTADGYQVTLQISLPGNSVLPRNM